MISTEVKDCPEPSQLRRFLLGELPIQEIELYDQHLRGCPPCVETLETLKAEDTFTGCTRQALDVDAGALNGDHAQDEQSIVGRLMAQAEHWSRANTEAWQNSESERTALDRAAEVVRLLGAPQSEHEMGQVSHFSVVELLGSGSTGVVFKARDLALDRYVVLKILRPSLGVAARTRFTAEARATAAIDHSNVVRIYEVGSDGPLSYIAMQWTAGETLEQRLQGQLPLSHVQIRTLVGEIANGLAAAHAVGLIHRDIKPANVWLAADTHEARILDFGLVRVADEDPQLTCTGFIAGTPCFMSPEQSRGDELDARSDLFSLGCLLYQTLTGRVPFRGLNALATLRSVQQDQPIAPATLDPSIPGDISDLTMCLLEKSPARRPPDASSVANALLNQREQWNFELPRSAPDLRVRGRRPATVRNWIAGLATLVGLGVFGGLYGEQIIRIVTNQGEIVIETDEPDVKIEILQQGEVIRVIDVLTDQSVEIGAGRYTLRPSGEDQTVTLDKNQLTLNRGGKEIVRVTRVTMAQSEPPHDPNVPHRLVPGDVLGIFIDGVLGEWDKVPPVHYPPAESGLPPVIGFPVSVEHDGKILLPFVEPIEVAGKTMDQVREDIRKAYFDGEKPYLSDSARLIVNLMQKTRTTEPGSQVRPPKNARTFDLPAAEMQPTSPEENVATQNEPVFSGMTYESAMEIIRTERDLGKLNTAIKAVATLADDSNQKEMLDAVMQVVRRARPMANPTEQEELRKILSSLLTSLNLPILTQLLIDELKSGVPSEESLRVISKQVSDKININESSEQAKRCLDFIIQAMVDYLDKPDNDKEALRLFSALYNISLLPSGKIRNFDMQASLPIVQKYFEQAENGSVMKHFGLYHVFMANWLGDSEPFIDRMSQKLELISDDVALLLSAAEKQWQAVVRNYVSTLLQTHDKNNDKTLSLEEIAKLPRPPIDADANQDAVFSEQELIECYLNRTGRNQFGPSKMILEMNLPHELNAYVWQTLKKTSKNKRNRLIDNLVELGNLVGQVLRLQVPAIRQAEPLDAILELLDCGGGGIAKQILESPQQPLLVVEDGKVVLRTISE